MNNLLLKNNKKKSKFLTGFTLVEMLVAIAVFMIVMTVAVGSLVSIVDANRKAQSMNTVVNNLNLATEDMSKNIRLGTKYACYISNSWYLISGYCNNGSNAIRYLSSDGSNWVTYWFNSAPITGDGNIMVCTFPSSISGTSNYCTPATYNTSSPYPWLSLTSPTSMLNITNTEFYVLGIGDPKSQPKVLITMEGFAGTSSTTQSSFTLQTTVSQRARVF